MKEKTKSKPKQKPARDIRTTTLGIVSFFVDKFEKEPGITFSIQNLEDAPYKRCDTKPCYKTIANHMSLLTRKNILQIKGKKPTDDGKSHCYAYALTPYSIQRIHSLKSLEKMTDSAAIGALEKFAAGYASFNSYSNKDSKNVNDETESDSNDNSHPLSEKNTPHQDDNNLDSYTGDNISSPPITNPETGAPEYSLFNSSIEPIKSSNMPTSVNSNPVILTNIGTGTSRKHKLNDDNDYQRIDKKSKPDEETITSLPLASNSHKGILDILAETRQSNKDKLKELQDLKLKLTQQNADYDNQIVDLENENATLEEESKIQESEKEVELLQQTNQEKAKKLQELKDKNHALKDNLPPYKLEQLVKTNHLFSVASPNPTRVIPTQVNSFASPKTPTN